MPEAPFHAVTIRGRDCYPAIKLEVRNGLSDMFSARYDSKQLRAEPTRQAHRRAASQRGGRRRGRGDDRPVVARPQTLEGTSPITDQVPGW